MSIVTIKPIKNANSHLPDSLLEDHVYRLGSEFRNGAPLIPFTNEENKWIMEYFNWDEKEIADRKKLKEFWINFTVKIDAGGKVLNITKDAKGNPVNLMDYCAYRFAKMHSQVAENEQSIGSGHRFYLIDPEYEKEKNYAKTKAITESMLIFAELSKDLEKSKYFYVILGGNRVDFQDEKTINNFLFQKATNEPDKFIQVSKDKNIEYRFLLRSFIEYNILRKIGSSYFRMDDEIAKNEDEMIAYLKSTSNKGTVSAWKSELKEKTSVSLV